ncbi:MAG: cytochrome c oxidase assembly protein [Rhodospirillaceae bacterium]|nr:cytochrome c oxidase assembly protein [Rhodospirillaceae bacterium]MBT5659161.1 cytochrome c oxidase assembly protein [Rhodospirillaceae bacterium]
MVAPSTRNQAPLAKRNKRLLMVLSVVVVGMVGLAFASVPLYRLFCQVTGYGGTTQTAVAAPGQIFDRVMTIRFNSDTSSSLPWDFHPSQKAVEVKIGAQGLAFFEAHNLSAETVTGSAVFNVTPLKAGKYFTKVACFCFDEQTLAPGQSVDMPVTFFVDPLIMDDPNMGEVKTITLSYTFFPADAGEEPDPSRQTSSLMLQAGSDVTVN